MAEADLDSAAVPEQESYNERSDPAICVEEVRKGDGQSGCDQGGDNDESEVVKADVCVEWVQSGGV